MVWRWKVKESDPSRKNRWWESQWKNSHRDSLVGIKCTQRLNSVSDTDTTSCQSQSKVVAVTHLKASIARYERMNKRISKLLKYFLMDWLSQRSCQHFPNSVIPPTCGIKRGTHPTETRSVPHLWQGLTWNVQTDYKHDRVLNVIHAALCVIQIPTSKHSSFPSKRKLIS